MDVAIPSSSPLPPRYAAWMYDLLGGNIPPESHATCADCAMCAPNSLLSQTGVDRQSEARFYDPGVKCCSYLPILWNFLVGDLLTDETSEAAAGRATVESRLAAGVAVTPLGLQRSPVYDTLYRHIGPAFGQTRSMLCPHYLSETGSCGVWRHRESTCATWFCKHERGAVGETFWDRLRQVLRIIEESLARWCVLELELGPSAVAALFPISSADAGVPKTAQDFDNLPEIARQRLLWGRWAGREREFYCAAADRVRPLNWQQVAALGGSRLSIHALLARDAYQALISRDLPSHLCARSVQFIPVSAQKCQVITYRSESPLQIPLKIVQVLHYFDGRPTSEAIEAILRDHNLRLAPSVIRKLLDHKVLAPAEVTHVAAKDPFG